MNPEDPGDISKLSQGWPRPAAPRPIVIIGAGGIVHDAHLPAYGKLGYPVAGIFDLDLARARATAEAGQISTVFQSLADAVRFDDAVFDLAVPPAAIEDIVAALPAGAGVLIQKPLGEDLAAATRIRKICRQRGLAAAVNFQLRFAPNMLALGDAIRRGLLGRIVEAEVRVNCRMPWELWPFMKSLRRMEIALHSIHYLDLLRSILGEPQSVMARTVKHPDTPELASTRTSAILDYGDDVRCCLTVHHHHHHGPKYQASELRLEGTSGAAVAVMGVNLDYPRGRPDQLDLAVGGADWHPVSLRGSWFPTAFEGPMSNLQRFVSGEDPRLISSVEDAWRTMALVEGLYDSDRSRGTPLPPDPDPLP